MARTPLYSRSPQRPAAPVTAAAPAAASPADSVAAPPADSAAAPSADIPPDTGPTLRQRLARRHERWLWATGALALAAVVGWPAWTAQVQRPLSLKQIDEAMRESIAKQPLASAAAGAYEAILPSVVRVVGTHGGVSRAAADTPAGKGPGHKRALPGGHPPVDDEEGKSVGTGVVVVDKGVILTNLHVVDGADRITVTFFDGTQSEAVVINHQRDQDLAVLQAKTIPDDLHAATLRSTAGLSPGDEVVAVGFPFGIGPSASAGIVSGLKREFRSPQGQRLLTNLIQFDAAANPGNSGGPLVTLDGHVVGIVTAIMNPNAQRTFIGIGFAVPIEAAAGAVGMHPF